MPHRLSTEIYPAPGCLSVISAHKYKSARNREGGIRRNEENILQAADPLRLSLSLALRTQEVNEKEIFTGEPNL